MQSHEMYPRLLKDNILLDFWDTADKRTINQEFLSELSQIVNGDNMEYANALFSIH